jgi:hypothetical protein
MNDQTHSSIPQKTKDSNSALNIGIGMLLGLIVALVVAYFAMSSGPFRDKANKNVLSDQQGNTDPNAPLYSNNPSATSTIPSNAVPNNEQGAGVGVLTNVNSTDTTAVTSTPISGNNDVDENNLSADAKTQAINTPKKASGNDAIAELITSKTKSKAVASTPSSSNESKATTSTPNTSSKIRVPASNSSDSGSAPKTVTPVTANNQGVK